MCWLAKAEFPPGPGQRWIYRCLRRYLIRRQQWCIACANKNEIGRGNYMRILLLTLVVPNPPDSGPKIKTHYLLRYLAQHHQVTLVSFVRSAEEAAAARAL